MTSISNNLSLGNVLQIDPGTQRLRKLSDEERQQYLENLEKMPDTRRALAAEAPAQGSFESLMRATQARSEFQAQQIAQEGTPNAGGAAADESAAGGSSAAQAFLDYMAKSPEERYFDAFLKSKGMTEEEFQALPPEEKQALMTEFEEAVKQRVENESAEKLAQSENGGLL